MKDFWALPVLLRVVIASHATFTVLDDILSYPQYEVIVSNNVLSDAEAGLKIASLAAKPSPASASSDASFDLSQISPDSNVKPKSPEEDEPKERIRDHERIRLGDQEFLCSIPQVVSYHETTSTPSPEEQEREVARATNHGLDLLKGMEGSCIFFSTGWWTYSFCFNQSVKQFHSLPPGKHAPFWPPTEDKSVQSFILGTFEDQTAKGRNKAELQKETAGTDVGTAQKNSTDTSLARLEQKGKLKYMVQELSGGTVCDLTGKPRRIEVQFHCHPSIAGDQIAAIKELATCTYLMIIQTARLCNDVAFQPPRKDKPNPIRCSPIIPDGTELADHPALAQALEAREQRQEQQQALEDETVFIDMDLPIYVGDIEFGGNRLLASPASLDADTAELDEELKHISSTGWLRDRASLANSLVLGGQKERLIATVASSKEEPLSAERLKELGIREREAGEINKYRKEMERRSEGKGWRLDVIETAEGREWRGIIEAEEGLLDKVTEAAKIAKDKKPAEKVDTEASQQTGQAEPAKEGSTEEGSEEVYKDEL